MPLFVAIFPPEEIRAAVLRISENRAEDTHWIAPDYLHITLRFFGDAPREPIIDRLSDLNLPTARVTIGPETTAPWGPRTLVFPVHGVDHLAAQIAAATTDIGRPPEDNYFAHLGVARSGASVEPLAGIPLEVAFDVTTVTLIDSDWTTFPPRYTKAGEFALNDAP